MNHTRPWHQFYSGVPESIDYPKTTMFESLRHSVERVPDKAAWDFLGTQCTYEAFGGQIARCANALSALGLKEEDVITISMPTSPQGVICFYAANKLGAVASMIHPLSTQKEIELYLGLTNSCMMLTLDAFGVCVNAAFMAGARSILVPQFTPDLAAKLIRAKKPSFIIGVPTLYAALNKNSEFKRPDLTCLKAAFCGADTLTSVVKNEFERIVREQGGKVKLLEGYGLTEAVTAVMATPLDHFREGSIGVPLPDMDAKIVRENSLEEAPIGEDGELCLHGPAVMKGYLNRKEETEAVLKRHDDGRLWLHTGDIACRDADGFFYFKLRQKRMIKCSGMNVYPAQVEEVLSTHPDVADACVVGVPDRDQVERVKAFVVLKPGKEGGPEMEKELIDYCRESLIKWSCPRNIEFRSSLPTTLVGKVAFQVLRDEEVERLRRQGENAGET